MTAKDPTFAGRSLFGYDVFISYRRGVATAYVRAFAQALQGAGRRVFLDERELISGDSIAREALRAARRSNVLVLVLSPAAFDGGSTWMRRELDEHNRRFRPHPLPVVFDATHRPAIPAPFAGLTGALNELEAPEALQRGAPTQAVIDAVLRTGKGLQVRHRKLLALVLTVLVIVGGGGIWLLRERAAEAELAARERATVASEWEARARAAEDNARFDEAEVAWSEAAYAEPAAAGPRHERWRHARERRALVPRGARHGFAPEEDILGFDVIDGVPQFVTDLAGQVQFVREGGREPSITCRAPEAAFACGEDTVIVQCADEVWRVRGPTGARLSESFAPGRVVDAVCRAGQVLVLTADDTARRVHRLGATDAELVHEQTGRAREYRLCDGGGSLGYDAYLDGETLTVTRWGDHEERRDTAQLRGAATLSNLVLLASADCRRFFVEYELNAMERMLGSEIPASYRWVSLDWDTPRPPRELPGEFKRMLPTSSGGRFDAVYLGADGSFGLVPRVDAVVLVVTLQPLAPAAADARVWREDDGGLWSLSIEGETLVIRVDGARRSALPARIAEPARIHRSGDGRHVAVIANNQIAVWSAADPPPGATDAPSPAALRAELGLAEAGRAAR